MPSQLQRRPLRRAASRYAARLWEVVAVLVVVTVGLVVAVRVLAPDPYVRRVSVENSSEYAVAVRAADDRPTGWMPVGTAEPSRTTDFADVYDQGDTWTFRFEYGSYSALRTVSRGDLQRSSWRVPVPVAFVEQLRTAEVPPTPDFAGVRGS